MDETFGNAHRVCIAQVTLVRPDYPESEVLWDFLDCQGPKGNLDQQAKRVAKVTAAQRESE